MGIGPCCCWSLRFGSLMVGVYTIFYAVIFMAVMAWRTAEISYKRDRMLGSLKPYDYEDVRRYPGSSNIYYRSPEVAWYTAIWILDIIRTCVLFFVLCGGVTLIWGVKAIIYWLVWFWVIWMSIDILFCFAHAIAWWTAQIRQEELQIVLPVFEVLFAIFHLYLLYVIFMAYKAMKRGEFSKRKEKYRTNPTNRQIIVDHSYDYDPFGAVFIDPFEEPKKVPPPTYYLKEDYNIPVKNEPNVHVRAPIDASVKKSVETYFTEPGRYSPPPLQKKELPTFDETEKPKFDRHPTPLPPKESENDSIQDMLDEKMRKELNDQLHTTGPLNMDDLRLDYEPSEDSIKPPRAILTLEDLAQKSKEKERKEKKKHKRHRHERHEHRSKDRREDRDRERRRSKDRHRDRDRDRDRDSRSHHRSRSHRHSPDRHRRSSYDRDRRSDRHERHHRRSRSSDYDRERRRRRSRRRSSSRSTSSSASPERPARQASVPIITRPSSGEDSGLHSNVPQPYLSDSDHVPRNFQINSEIQISYPRPQPIGTAGTQLPLYTTSVPAAPK